jgi:hypothetical protein
MKLTCRAVARALTSRRRPPRSRATDTMQPMRRVLLPTALALVCLLVLAPLAGAHDGGEGLWGETNDKVVTNAGFILIAFFPLFIFVMSMLQMALDRRKDRRKKALKALAREDRVRGGW